jgi:pimeloyl-ACP methyl ester carboxylesterase
MCADAWAPQFADLARDFRVIAMNMPGHGGSDLLAENARLPDYVRWASSVIEALEVGRVNVAGHSMGALIATGLAVERPDLIARVAVLNGVHRRSAQARADVELRATQIASREGDILQPLERWFDTDPAQSAIREQVSRWLARVDHAGYADAYRAFAEGDTVYSDRWADVACPALALTSDGDRNSTPEMAHAMADAADEGVAVVIVGHRHMVNLTAPDRVNAALRDWLRMQEKIQ